MNTIDPRFDENRDDESRDDDLFAGEYVLGVLNVEDHHRARARIDAEPAFAELVDAWEQRLAGLADEIAPADVPAQLWPRIRTRLGWSPIEGRKPQGMLQSVGFWRAATAAAAVLAVVALFVGRGPEPSTPVQPPVVAVQPPPVAPVVEQPKPVTTLAHDDGTPGWLASIDVARGAVMMVPVPAAADPQGRVPELWLIPPGESPRSLGLVSIDKAHSVAVPKDLQRALAAGSTLAITLEPAGGAPKGVPTGPIIAKGGIQNI